MDGNGSVAKLVKTVDYRDIIHYESGGNSAARWPSGTWQDPCGSLASVRAMLTARQLDRVWIHGAATLDAAMAALDWYGEGAADSVALAAKSVTGSTFKNLMLTGAAYAASVDSIYLKDCIIAITTNPISLIAERCIIGITGATLVIGAGTTLDSCYGPMNDDNAYISAPGASFTAFITKWAGRLKLQDIEAGGEIFVDGVGTLIVDGTGGTVHVRGDIEVTDLSGGAVTIDDDTSYNQRVDLQTDVTAILAAVTGGAADLRITQSISGKVEEDGVLGFDISIFDIDAGAVASADIDITGISAVLEKSTGGGAFSSVGITQPTFAKADGRVYVAYRFLAAEWTAGDIYRLRVTGIQATVDGDTLDIPAMVWANSVSEDADIKSAVDTINAEVAKVVGATGILFEQADVPVTMNATDVEADILDLSTASTRYMLRDLLIKCADPGAETVTVRLYRLINDVQTLVKDFDITTTTYTGYFNLMDMFGVPHLAGDDIRITVIASAAGPYAITGQYSYAKTNV
jgi:hypothetical protein